MILMVLLMSLPLLGLALFFLYPWRVALGPYLVLVGVSALFNWLMLRAMRLPVRTGREEMAGSTAVVLNWKGRSGQVVWGGEIWRAQAEAGRTFTRGESVVIDSVSGLVLSVKATAAAPPGSRPRTGDRASA